MANTATADAIATLLPTIKAAIDKPSTPVAENVANQVAVAVTNEVAPILVHATNTEPWYASRVTIGALLGGVGALYTLILDFYTPPPPTTEILLAQLTVIVGSVTTLYGRWRAIKPLGS